MLPSIIRTLFQSSNIGASIFLLILTMRRSQAGTVTVCRSRRKDALEPKHELKSGLGHGYDPSRQTNHHHILAWRFRCWFVVVPV